MMHFHAESSVCDSHDRKILRVITFYCYQYFMAFEFSYGFYILDNETMFNYRTTLCLQQLLAKHSILRY